jgi:hypothetical protein
MWTKQKPVTSPAIKTPFYAQPSANLLLDVAKITPPFISERI